MLSAVRAFRVLQGWPPLVWKLRLKSSGRSRLWLWTKRIFSSTVDQLQLSSLLSMWLSFLRQRSSLNIFHYQDPLTSIWLHLKLWWLEVKREYYQNCFIYCQRATSSMGTVNKNSSYSPVGPWVCLFVFFRLHDLSLCWCMFCFTLDSWVISLHVVALA